MPRRAMKIAYLIGSMRKGGAEGQVAHLVRHFRGGEFQSVLFLLQETGDHLEGLRALGVPIRGFDFKKRHAALDPRTWLQVRRTIGAIAAALREESPDLLHCFLFWADALGARAGRRAGVPRIVTSRRSLGDFKRGRPWMQWVENRTNRLVDAVTVNSEAVRADALALEKIAPEKIHLLYNGVEIGAPPDGGKKQPLLDELGLGADDEAGPLILHVANLIHYKGHLTLIDAMQRVVREFPACRLALAGRDGGMEAAVRRSAAQKGLTQNVRFLGQREELGPLYAAADLVVLPSYEEGFPNVILEAMAASRPIVASRVGGIPEAIADGVEGRLVPPRDANALARAMIELLNDAPRCESLGRAARARAERDFSLPAMLANYEQFYRKLIGSEAR